MLIAAPDAHAYAFVISVATAGKYVRLKSVQVHKEFHKPTRFDYICITRYCSALKGT